LGTSKGIGIGVGITVGVIAVGFLIFEMGSGSVNVIEEIEDIVVESEDIVVESEDARLARIQANYFVGNDRLDVRIILTDSNADYTKASGEAFLFVEKDGNIVYASEVYSFDKRDFVSWRDNSGNKLTGYIIDVREYFPSGSHDVFVTVETDGGTYWESLHDSFYSLE